MARKSQSPQRYAAPSEEREVVVSVDRRLLGVVALLLVFGVAIGIGALAAGRGATGTATAPPAASDAAAQVAAQQADAARMRSDVAAAATAAAAQSDGSYTVLDPGAVSIPEQVLDTPAPPAEEGAAASSDDVESVFEEMRREGVGQEVPLGEIKNRNAENWTHEEFATLGDPNVTSNDYRPYRAEDFESERMDGGPRLAVAGLNGQFTYDFGIVPMDEVATQDFWLRNVGDADLVIKRVYSGCGCTAPRIGELRPDGAGWLPELITLAPGEQVDLTVEFDPRLAKEAKAQAKVIQIFSNDPTKAMFDDADPLSHETRFRIVVQPDPFLKPGTDG